MPSVGGLAASLVSGTAANAWRSAKGADRRFRVKPVESDWVPHCDTAERYEDSAVLRYLNSGSVPKGVPPFVSKVTRVSAGLR